VLFVVPRGLNHYQFLGPILLVLCSDNKRVLRTLLDALFLVWLEKDRPTRTQPQAQKECTQEERRVLADKREEAENGS
jgi:hypothetical protein